MSSGSLTTVYTTGANGLVSRWTPGSGEVYYAYNPIGDVSDRLNSAGAILSTDVYDAYGQQLIGLTTDPYGYKGQYGYYTDRPATNRTDLILTTFRYYDPNTGRFLTRDPIGYSGGLNLYGYVEGNPVNRIDPLGLSQKPKGMKNGDIGLSFAAFIPTPNARGPLFLNNPRGDNRDFSSDSSSFRAQFQIILHPDGTVDGWAEIGLSTPLWHWQGAPTHAPASEMGMSAYPCGDGNWEIFLKGTADYPFAISPHIDYNLHITVTPNGVWVSGATDEYPAYELWQYKNSQAYLKWGRKPIGWASVLSLAGGPEPFSAPGH